MYVCMHIPSSNFILFVAVTKTYYVLGGQHIFVAASEIGKELDKGRQQPPTWTRSFSCSVIRAETSLAVRQIIAGKLQSQQASVSEQGLFERGLKPIYRFILPMKIEYSFIVCIY